MPTYKVAHIREQGQDMLIFPLASAFGNQSHQEQNRELGALERQAHHAGLKGSAVAIWQDSSGRTHFMGPTPWHPYLQGLSYQAAYASVNRTISW